MYDECQAKHETWLRTAVGWIIFEKKYFQLKSSLSYESLLESEQKAKIDEIALSYLNWRIKR